jgi:hypothetical protein
MNISTVGELEELLATIKDKSLPIRIVNEQKIDEENIWAHSIELNNTGDSGYECCGEVRIIGNE